MNYMIIDYEREAIERKLEMDEWTNGQVASDMTHDINSIHATDDGTYQRCARFGDQAANITQHSALSSKQAAS